MIVLDALRFLQALHSADSLAAAARRLNVSAPAVTLRLQALEARLGVALLHRHGRGLLLTDEGELLVRGGAHLLAEAEALTEALEARRGTMAGLLRVVAPFGFGRDHVAPFAARFRTAHPGVELQLTLTDRLGRIPESLWDIAVHVGDLDHVASSVPIQKLASNRRLLCAAPEYLARRGRPTAPQDLRDHDCLALQENDEDHSLWRFTGGDGQTVRLRIDPAMSTNDGSVLKSWALAGLGIITRSEWDVAGDVAAGRLVRLLPDWALPQADVLAMLGARATARTARAQAFLQGLRAEMATPAWTTA